ncbi:MAG: hypothetical protein ABSF40_05605 [Candidatus Acidiferrales bacterium]|jgi:hypothetical protein
MAQGDALVPLTYQSGKEIRKGDRVLYFDDSSEIEFVADPLVDDVKTAWYVQEYGGGVMVVENEFKNFGRVFITEPEDDCDLIFVSRQD